MSEVLKIEIDPHFLDEHHKSLADELVKLELTLEGLRFERLKLSKFQKYHRVPLRTPSLKQNVETINNKQALAANETHTNCARNPSAMIEVFSF